MAKDHLDCADKTENARLTAATEGVKGSGFATTPGADASTELPFLKQGTGDNVFGNLPRLDDKDNFEEE